MKKLIYILAFLAGTTLNAQSNYHTAIGLRAGETSGLTVKQFVGSGTAFEGILGAWRHGVSATLLFEKYKATTISNLNWYYGGGGHVAFENTYYDRYYFYNNGRYYATDYYVDGGMGLGIDGVLGLEYKIQNAPIAFSLDMKPFIEFNTHGGVWTSIDPSLGIKIAF